MLKRLEINKWTEDEMNKLFGPGPDVMGEGTVVKGKVRICWLESRTFKPCNQFPTTQLSLTIELKEVESSQRSEQNGMVCQERSLSSLTFLMAL